MVMLSKLRASDIPSPFAVNAAEIRVVRDRDLEGFDVAKGHDAKGGFYYTVRNSTHWPGYKLADSLAEVRAIIRGAVVNVPLSHYVGASVPLMHGTDCTVDVHAHGGIRPSASLNLDGPISVHSSLTPANARALAAELVKAADAAERRPSMRLVNQADEE